MQCMIIDICDDIDVGSSDTDSDEEESDPETSTTRVPPTTPRSRRKIQEAADMVINLSNKTFVLLDLFD